MPPTTLPLSQNNRNTTPQQQRNFIPSHSLSIRPTKIPPPRNHETHIPFQDLLHDSICMGIGEFSLGFNLRESRKPVIHFPREEGITSPADWASCHPLPQSLSTKRDPSIRGEPRIQ